MEDMADMKADMEEINEVMGMNFDCEFDENDLMDELNELDEDIANEQMGDTLPSYIPATNKDKSSTQVDAGKNEEDALKNMMEIWYMGNSNHAK